MLPLACFVRRALALCPLVAAAPALAITVNLTELPVPDGYGTAGVANLASDGTAVGMVWPDALVVRWAPGAEPEVLGGGMTYTLENVMPLVSKDGSVIATTGYFSTGGDGFLASPEIWMGGTDWMALPELTLGDASPYGMSYDGQMFVGGASPADGDNSGVQQYPWLWTASGGQQALGMMDGTVWGEAWAVSNDGHTAVGFFEAAEGDSTRYGARWTDGVPEWILDSEGEHVGQAIGCNHDCSVVVGAGRDADSPLAWRWTAANGVEYLDPIPEEDPSAVYYAFESSDDGHVVVGSAYTIGGVNHGFMWTPADHTQNIVSFLSLYGIDYGSDFADLVVNAVTPDGRTMLINAEAPDFTRERAIVRIVPDDEIYADGFDIIPI
jgi:uncharacterized membrane protein